MKNILKKIDKQKIINVIIVLFIISLYVFTFLFIYNSFRERKRKEIENGLLNKVDKVINENKKKDITSNDSSSNVVINYNGFNYTVLGKLIVKKINMNVPILKENNDASYNTSAVKISGPPLNEYGNVAIGGHNFMKGEFMIKIMKLTNNDVITITDLTGRSVNYYVYEFKTTSIDDASYLIQPDNKNEKIVTLVTCTKGGKQRYYVKAKAK